MKHLLIILSIVLLAASCPDNGTTPCPDCPDCPECPEPIEQEYNELYPCEDCDYSLLQEQIDSLQEIIDNYVPCEPCPEDTNNYILAFNAPNLYYYDDAWKLFDGDSVCIKLNDSAYFCISKEVIEIPDTIPQPNEPDFVCDFTQGWENDLRQYFGTFSFQYSCEDLTKNYYETINEKLHLVINEGCDYSGRVQGTLVMSEREVYHFKQDYFIDDGFDLEGYSGYAWILLFEFWEQHNDIWDGNSAGQIHFPLYIQKSNGLIYWHLMAQKMQPADQEFSNVWDRISTKEVPIGEWFTMEFYIERGNPGRYLVKLNDEVLFDVKDATVYPDHKMPVSWFQPWKWYMNIEFVNYSAPLEIWCDNFKWYED
ncbi:hypothetical protein JW960_26155 [candidate division KSB1 bacterium]|nr:hypothetical protein [candidate division KSB1 bacterium]